MTESHLRQRRSSPQVSIYAVLSWRAQDHISHAGFWFEDVSFESPHFVAAGYGGPLTDAEQTLIREAAWSEVRAAFAGLRIRFSEDREAFYRVRVVQEFGPGIRGAAGATRVLPPLGGNGSVNFLMLASQAVSHAPDGADRATVVLAIGRGVGRAAVHEFLHQLLPRLNIHESKDDRSYEFGTRRGRRSTMETCAGTSPDRRWWRDSEMCRNIKTLANFAPPATDDEIRASAIQFVRKLSGTSRPSRANEDVFNRAVDEVTSAAQRLIHSLTTSAAPRNREDEARKARERSERRFA